MVANTSMSAPERPPKAIPAFTVKPFRPAETDGDTGTQHKAVERCGCGGHAEYRLGRYALCDDCAWSLAEQGGAP